MTSTLPSNRHSWTRLAALAVGAASVLGLGLACSSDEPATSNSPGDTNAGTTLTATSTATATNTSSSSVSVTGSSSTTATGTSTSSAAGTDTSSTTGSGDSGGAGGADGSESTTAGENATGTTTGSGGTGGGTTFVPGTENYDCSPPTGTLPTLQLTPFVEGLDNPIYVTHAPNELDRLFVIEQRGKIRVVKEGTLVETPYLDISTKVDLEIWEQGLLGLAFHPDYAENGLFYVHYSSKGVEGYDDGAGIIAEYEVSADNPDVADATSERILLGAPTTNKYHNGGSIFFGPDKLLFIFFGDGAGDTSNPDLFPGADPNDALERANSQDLTSLRGKILRINPLESGAEPYTCPEGNLIDEEPTARCEISSYGLRNPYRANMDPCTGDIYIGDVGDRAWESIDIEKGFTGHLNYGWPIREGDACHKDTMPADSCTDPDHYRGPFDVHPSGESGVANAPQFQASIGGSVYRGSAIPALRGTYFFADLYGPTKTLRYDAATDSLSEAVKSVETQTNPAEDDQGIVAIQNGGDGELYFVSRGGSAGSDLVTTPLGVIYKLEAVP